jgi:hypothetical protein
MSARSLWAALAVCCALGAVLLWAGCALSPINRARLFTSGMAEGGLAAGQAVAAANEARVAEVEKKLDDGKMSAEDGKRERGKLKYQYGIADRAVKTFSTGIAGLRASIQVYQATKKFDLGPLLRAGVQLFSQLQAALKAYGIEIPMPNIGGL